MKDFTPYPGAGLQFCRGESSTSWKHTSGPTPAELRLASELKQLDAEHLAAWLTRHIARETSELRKDRERLEWILEKPSRLPIDKGNGEWLVQEYVGHTTGRGNSKREAIDSAMRASK